MTNTPKKNTNKQPENKDDWIVDDGEELSEDIRQEIRKLAYDLGKSHSAGFMEHLDKKYNK